MNLDRRSWLYDRKTSYSSQRKPSFLASGLHEASKTFVSIKQCTSFTPEVVDHLERTNPDLLAWLRSTCGFVFQGALIFFYIMFETLSGLLLSYVLKPNVRPRFTPLPSSIIVMKSLSSIIIGLSIQVVAALCSDRTFRAVPRAFAAVFQWRLIFAYSFVALLLCVSDVFGLMAYTKLDAGVKKILDQLRLPITAAMGTMIVGKHYSLMEWAALLIMLLAICSFYMANTEHDGITALHTKCRYPQHCFSEPAYGICARQVDGSTIIGELPGTAIERLGAAVRKDVNATRYNIRTFEVGSSTTDWAGLTFSLVAGFSNCAGVILNEKLMKRDAAIPFYSQKVQIELTGLPAAMSMSFLVPLFIESKGGKAIWWTQNEAEGSGQGFFQGYTQLTVVVIAVGLVQAWMGGLIVKRFSALVQKISKCFILILMVFCNGVYFKSCQANDLPLTMYCLAFVVAAATLLFASMPKLPSTPTEQPQLPASPRIPTCPRSSSIITSRAGSETLLNTDKFVLKELGGTDSSIQLKGGSVVKQ